MAKILYNVQCLMGHVYSAIPESNLEKRCIKREEQGYLDALVLHSDECEVCIEETLQKERKNIEMLD